MVEPTRTLVLPISTCCAQKSVDASDRLATTRTAFSKSPLIPMLSSMSCNGTPSCSCTSCRHRCKHCATVSVSSHQHSHTHLKVFWSRGVVWHADGHEPRKAQVLARKHVLHKGHHLVWLHPRLALLTTRVDLHKDPQRRPTAIRLACGIQLARQLCVRVHRRQLFVLRHPPCRCRRFRWRAGLARPRPAS